MGRRCWLLCAVLIVPVCWALVPEISLKSINNHVQPPNEPKSTDNDVISDKTKVAKWPTLNVTRIKTTTTATSYNATALLIDDKFDVVDPVPSSVAQTINTIKDHAGRKTRHRNKWMSHSVGKPSAAKTSASTSVWNGQNDILSATNNAASLP